MNFTSKCDRYDYKHDSFFIRKHHKSLLQNVSAFLLQHATALLQNVTVITK